MSINRQRKLDGGAAKGAPPTKKARQDVTSGSSAPAGKAHLKNKGSLNSDGNRSKKSELWKPRPAPDLDRFPSKNKQNEKKHGSSKKKQHLTSIVTEAKANYQLFSDKKADKKEKQMLMNSTYELVKDHIPELARMKGMGKVIAALVDNPNKQRQLHALNSYASPEAKLLLMRGNGYRLAMKLIQTGTGKTVNQFIEACLSNSKGLRVLMSSFQSARSLCSAYQYGNVEAKRRILEQMVLGNMSLPKDSKKPLDEIFTECKSHVTEECKTFLMSILNEKTLEYDLIQDMLTLCLQTHQSTGMEVEEFVKLGSEHIVPICRRTSNSTLTLWIVWLSNAQMRKHIMKGLKGKVVSLLQTYNGRMFLMALCECTDDTKALDKIVLKEFLDSMDEVVQNADGRKLLEFLLKPRSTKFMHPKDIAILAQGDAIRTSKKSNDTRFDEIRGYVKKSLISTFDKNYSSWLLDNKMCLFVIAVVDIYGVSFEEKLFQKLTKTLASSEFSERISDKAVRMVLESLLSADMSRYAADETTSLFLNEFILSLEKHQEHISNLIEKCPRLLSQMTENAEKLEKALTFKPKKSWLYSKIAQDAIKKCRSETPQQKHK